MHGDALLMNPVQGPRLEIHTRERRFLIEDPAPVETLLRGRGTPIEYLPGEQESRVTTLYFDTAQGTWSQGRGTTKFRCKIYGDSPTLWFELKRRVGTMVDKWRRPVTAPELQEVLAGTRRGDALTRFVGSEPLLTIGAVTYRRTAFEWSGLRVTVDRDVRFYAGGGLEPGRPLGDLDRLIVEVKCAGALPAWLVPALRLSRARQFSKSKRVLALLRPPTRAAEAS